MAQEDKVFLVYKGKVGDPTCTSFKDKADLKKKFKLPENNLDMFDKL